MKLAIMQPYFMPYLGYWQLINAVDKFVILDDVTFIKQGYINRNSILSQNKAQKVNIHVNAISSSKLISEHELSNNYKWKKKLLTTIQQNYSKAKYFNYSFPIIEECILFDEINLSKYLTFQIKKISSFLNIDTEIIRASFTYSNNGLKGQNRILNICKEELASTYINAIGGQELYSRNDFTQHNIELKFIKTDDRKYPQFSNKFVPFLSIIDVMMFNSVEAIQKMLIKYTLV